MKLKTLLTLCMALAIGAAGARAEEDTPLAKKMSEINKNLRNVKRSAADPAKKADNIAAVTKMSALVDDAMKLEPAKTKDQPAADKAAYLAKYKEQLTELKKTFGELKAAFEKG